ncbi:MAG: SDR family NAD(P)-dependent oxidoreductase [Nitrososphaeraceae archaeon]|nr:SDR family NAD(P)-dependent oxidoreductase [Nitrososphaeraceae archaeon]
MSNKVDARQKVAVITGSSRGIGLETSLTLAENGFTVYPTVRNIDKASNLTETANKRNLLAKVVQLDVINDTSVRQAIPA